MKKKQLETPKTAVIFARASTKTLLKNQVETCRKYLETKDYKVTKILESTRDDYENPSMDSAWGELSNLIWRNSIDAVAVTESDRLTMDWLFKINIIADCLFFSVKLITVKNPTELFNSREQLAINYIMGVSKTASELKAKRQKSKMQ